MTDDEVSALFDSGYENGLVNGKHQGQVEERERIIALLEAELGNLYGPDRERLIALIKGDGK